MQSTDEKSGIWFLQSGIQDETGGVARYYHSDTQRNARVSTEITGYAVKTLVYLYGRHGNEAFRTAAVRAGRFLTRSAWRADLASFPFEYSANGDAPEYLSYFFDTGIIIRGLLSLWRLEKDAEYLDVAVAAGVSLADDFDAGDRFHPIIDLPRKAPLPWASQWSRQPGCYQLKSALAWHDLYEATGDRRFASWYETAQRICTNSKDAFLPADTRERTMDRLHAYCYFLEGLLPCAAHPEVRTVIEEGIQRVSRYLREIAPVFERSDVYAQLLRVRILAGQIAGVPLDREEAAEEAARIEEFRFDHADPRIDGGFWFGRKGAGLLPFVNPVSTAFCLQALDMWHAHLAGEALDYRSLI